MDEAKFKLKEKELSKIENQLIEYFDNATSKNIRRVLLEKKENNELNKPEFDEWKKVFNECENLLDINNKKTIISNIKSLYYKGLKFSSNDSKAAGKLKKQKNIEEIKEFLKGKGEEDLHNFKPPVKCIILAQNRPYEDWPIYQASCKIQRFVYDLPYEGLLKLKLNEVKLSKKLQEQFIIDNEIYNYNDFKSVKGLRKIIECALNNYLGTEERLKNNNQKKKEKHERKNKSKLESGQEIDKYIETPIFDSTGCLTQKPGINKNIFTYQDVKIKSITIDDLKLLPPIYHNYIIKNDNEIISKSKDRLSIPEGEPGYVPLHHRALINTSKRIRKWYSSNKNKEKSNRKHVYSKDEIEKAKINDSLLVKLNINNDWLIFDARGLLRAAYYRNLIPKNGISLKLLLELFEHNAVIDTQKDIITFLFKEGKIPVCSKKVIKHEYGHKQLIELARTGKKIGLISVDLGQTNIVSYKISEILFQDDKLVSKTICREFLSSELLNEIKKYRQDFSKFEEKICDDAKLQLTKEEQNIINDYYNKDLAEKAKINLCTHFKLDKSLINWNDMNSCSYIIANSLPETINDKGKKDKIRDIKFYKQFKPHIDEKLNQKYEDIKKEIKKNNSQYKVFSKRQLEITRRCINYIIKKCYNLTACDTLFLAIEDLDCKENMHGKGKRENGWNNFSNHKKENRWWINSFHKQFSSLANDKGLNVVECQPSYTSQTCTQCKYSDRLNRNGEVFVCKKCNYKANADLDIATDNIESIVLTGLSMQKQQGFERSSDEQKSGTARKRGK